MSLKYFFRDINTRNILVRADLSCCISDFGSSIRLRGSTIFRNGTVFSAETGCLPDAGTIRYLSPELLEGCLNLFDCEASLKQADVYAVALVFWELSRRCRDLYQVRFSSRKRSSKYLYWIKRPHALSNLGFLQAFLQNCTQLLWHSFAIKR